MKKTISFILLLVFTVTLVSCGGEREGNSDVYGEWYDLAKDAEYDGEKVSIKFWHRMGEGNQQMVQQMIADFNEIYPNIEVIEEKAADDYDALSDKIALAIPAGNQPDISESYPDHIARYGKAVLALNNFIDNDNFGYSEEEQSDFLSGLWAEGESYDDNGTILSLPFTKSSEALFYNKAYFDEHGYEAPRTWEEVFTIAEDIKDREPGSYPFGYDSSDNFFITGSEQWQAPYTGFDEETGAGKVLFNNDESKEMIKYFKDKVDRKLMLTRTLNGDAFTSDIMKTGEKLYMFVGSTGGARYSIEGAEAAFAEGYRVGVAPVPVKSLDHKRQIQQGPNINLFQSDDEQKMIAAWLFSQFMITAENTAAFALQSGYAPVRHSAYETDTWLNYVESVPTDPQTPKEAGKKVIKEAIEIFRDNESIFFTSPVFNLSSKTRGEVGALLNKIMAYEGENLDSYIDTQYQDSYEFIVN